ncbi:hypothetical protein MGYG_01524 [Nannizzia gypsea CBS 118893]|uniref:Uncharacterized protein n=1 Tax=Arthroderma gypseum (strain ATCC MYA-4604 / CBS 118893) TaxID=535722 RepID=E5R1G1_ARTGP|nr:hypothetical protein MGYG_01524 [Nannizzia gypsea CBS 118893]EFQ98497.1 hypothetical protein MGYG_01524 [Nannizzia gypsea CBS 118893]
MEAGCTEVWEEERRKKNNNDAVRSALDAGSFEEFLKNQQGKEKGTNSSAMINSSSFWGGNRREPDGSRERPFSSVVSFLFVCWAAGMTREEAGVEAEDETGGCQTGI